MFGKKIIFIILEYYNLTCPYILNVDVWGWNNEMINHLRKKNTSTTKKNTLTVQILRLECSLALGQFLYIHIRTLIICVNFVLEILGILGNTYIDLYVE